MGNLHQLSIQTATSPDFRSFLEHAFDVGFEQSKSMRVRKSIFILAPQATKVEEGPLASCSISAVDSVISFLEKSSLISGHR
jgi:hypothetical protein